MEKVFRLLSLVLLTTSLVACGGNKPQEEVAKSDTKYPNGTYYGEAKGHEGLIKVEVIVKDNMISEVNVLESVETIKNALTMIPDRMVSTNSVDVDTVSGNSESSKAIIKAVKLALKLE